VNESSEYEFTYACYRQLLSELTDAGLTFTSYDGGIEDGDVLLRHDVDLSVDRAVRMAEIEASVGVQSTYFLLLTSCLYNVLHDQTRDQIDYIQSLGHDVELHFSTHQYYDNYPDDQQLTEHIRAECDILGTVSGSSVNTVSFHVPPEWVLRRSFDGFVSTYEERFFSEIPYRGDSNQRWRADPPFDTGYPGKVQILVHPGLWGEDDQGFESCVRRAVDNRMNSINEFVRQQYIDDKLSD
jgi:peptidoglycan/xylan/chitin deacetylase (PgdA/CDA1 family)